MDLIGRTFGAIRIDALLGSGGMGEVYLGYDQRLERKVAVKALNDRTRFSPESKARLTREAKVLSRLGDPAICQIHDWLETPEGDLLVLEFVDGATLREALRVGRLSLAALLGIVRSVALALVAAHRERIVHRDLKPDNIMVGADLRVKVLDFGIARIADQQPARVDSRPTGSVGGDDHTQPTQRIEPAAVDTLPTERSVPTTPSDATGDGDTSWRSDLTEQGVVLGTRRYMSPEQAQGREVQGSSDIYSLGVLLAESLTQLKPKPSNEDLPPNLRLLIETMQRVDPTRRPSAEEVVAGIDDALAWPQAKLRARLRRRIRIVLGALLLIAVTVVGYFAWRAEVERAKAEVRQAQAEKLIGFMLGDLRARLNRIGKLDLLAGVNERAEEYFAAIPAHELTDRDLAARVQSLLQVAEVAKEQGQYDAAARATERAVLLAEQFHARSPSDPAAIDGLASAKEWQAFLKLDQLDGLDGAEKLFDESTRLREHRLAMGAAGSGNNDVDALRNLASSYNNRGSARFALDRMQAALADLALATATWDRVLGIVPDDAEALGNRAGSLGWQSSAELALGLWRDGARTRASQVADLRRLNQRDPDHAGHREDLGVALRYLGDLEARFGDLRTARAAWQEARELTASGLANEPSSVDLMRLAATIDLHEGEGLLLRAEFVDALGPLDAARERLDTMLVAQQDNADLKSLRARARVALSEAFAATGNDDAFKREERAARDALMQLAGDAAHADDARRGLYTMALLRAGVDRSRGANDAADSALAMARTHAAASIDPFDLDGLRLHCIELGLLGDKAGADTMAQRLRDHGYRWSGLDD